MSKTILFIGLSHKLDKNWKLIPAFSSETASWKILQELKNRLPESNLYFSNLVKIAPLDINGKLRYPNHEEMLSGLLEIKKEILTLKSDLIFLCGNQVSEFIKNNLSLVDHPFVKKMIKIYHPSYISVYKKHQKEDYINTICEIIREL